MNALSIFAGVDKGGVIRFVADVPRGAACGCSCAACGSPLVARRGDIREWHFAHEASQERPECLAGAVNLLRRLAIEQLQTRELQLPPCHASFSTSFPLPLVTESAQWDVELLRIEAWDLQAAKHAPVARLQLSHGREAALHVEIDQGAVHRRPGTDAMGKLLFWVPLPSVGQLRALEDAQRHIGNAGQFIWLCQPDVHGLAAAAKQRLDARIRGLQKVPKEIQSLRTIAARQQTWSPVDPPAPAQHVPSPWDAWRKPHSSLILYGLNDGTAWVIVRHRDERAVLAPWPIAEDGWDESLPLSVGLADLELGGYVLANETRTMIAFRPKADTVRNFSTYAELVAFDWPS